MEPLSGHFFYPAPFPGRSRWLPATAKPTFDATVEGDEAQVELVWKDSVVFESRGFECLLKFIKKSIFPCRESV